MKCHKKSIELYAICGVNKIGPLILCLLHRQKDVCGIPDPSSLQKYAKNGETSRPWLKAQRMQVAEGHRIKKGP